MSHTSSHWVEVNVCHATEYRLLIKQGLGLVASLPEVAGAIVFSVGSASDAFIEEFHKPADIKESFSPAINEEVHLIAFVRLNGLMVGVLMCNLIARHHLMRPTHDIDGTGGKGVIASYVQQQMMVIRHHTERRNVDKEDRGQSKHIILDLLFSMLEAAPSLFVYATEKGTPDTARNAVVERGVVERDLLLTRLGHSGYFLRQITVVIVP
jgi:hypothetical protein